MKRFLLAVLVLTVPLALPAPLPAQQTPLPAQGFLTIDGRTTDNLDENDARRVRQELQELLRQHPPAVRAVFQADPSLLSRPDYLAAYPRLATFVKEHPEVARDPGFFFGQFDTFEPRVTTPQERAFNLLGAVLAGLALFTVGMTALFTVGFMIRQIFEHRRWVRQSRVQTEVHTKILDRLQSNEDLLTYVQTPAGRQFLEAGPSAQRAAAPPVAAPLGRMLWAVQAGVVLIALGSGLWLVQRMVMEEIAPAFYAMSVVAGALGVGAILSAGASYLLSARLGLLTQTPKENRP
jgi:hypothetical protein